MHFLQSINCDISVLIFCNKTGGTIKGDIKKYISVTSKQTPSLNFSHHNFASIYRLSIALNTPAFLQVFDMITLILGGDRGGTVVKVLCYKSEGHCFDPRWRHWNFSLT